MRLNQRKPAGFKLMMSVAVLALLFCAASPVWAVPREIVNQDNKLYDWKPLQKNNFFIATTNYGQIGQVRGGGDPYGFWPAPAIDANGDLVAPTMNYIFGWGLWIGAQVRSTKPGKTRDTLTTVGYNPNNSTGEYTAGAVIGGVPQSVTSADVKIYSSLEADWPLKTTGGKDSVLSVEDTRAIYNDYGLVNHATGGSPLKVQVTQTTYQWNYPTNQDIIFFLFEVKNTSTDPKDTLFDLYLAPTADCDIGNESGTAANDVCYYDATTNMTYQYQVSQTEVNWTRDAGCVGFMFLESPKATKDYTFPDGYKIYKDSTIGLFAFKNFNIAVDPPDDIAQYKELAGYNYTTGEFKRLDPKPSPGDCRFMESTGPIDMAPGTDAKTIVAVIAANFDYSNLGVSDTLAISDLRAKAKSAKLIYDANWLLPGPPPAPVLNVTPGHRRVIIGWDKSSEDTLNPKNKNMLYAQKVTRDSSTLAKFDPNFLTNILQGYKLYKSDNGSDWTLMAQWDKDDRYIVDSVGIHVTGPETLMAAQWLPADTTYKSVVYNPNWVVSGGTYQPFPWPDPAFLTDTRGSNTGLQYSYVDENLINGFTYYYSVRAYGINWQSTLNAAKDSILSKEPAFFQTAISENVTPVVPRSEPNEYVQPQAYVSDYAGKAFNVSQKVAVTIDLPRAVKTTTFKQFWGSVTRSPDLDPSVAVTQYVPVLRYGVIDANGDTVVPLTISQMLFDTLRGTARWMKVVKYTPGNYITIINDFLVNKSGFAVKGIIPHAGYTDTASAAIILTTSLDLRWAFRSGKFEIRWFDHNPENPASLPSADTLWPQVWHVVDSVKNIVVKVPYDSSSTTSVTTSSWNLGATTAGLGRRYIVNVSNLYLKYMNLCGVRVFFNNPLNSATGLNMVWARKPANGDIWRLYTSGTTVPVEGEYQIITTNEYQFVNSVADMSKIKVVPNPYIGRNIWERTNDRNKLQFVNLPTKCTIKIYTLAGNLVKMLEHDDNNGTDGGTCWWDPMLTMNQQQLASGVYLYYVDAPGIGTYVGKFAVVR